MFSHLSSPIFWKAHAMGMLYRKWRCYRESWCCYRESGVAECLEDTCYRYRESGVAIKKVALL